MSGILLKLSIISFRLLFLQAHASTLANGKALSGSSHKYSLNSPVSSQFYPGNKAISPFIVSNYSTLPPGLWLPPSWSFSIGLDWGTFQVDGGTADVIYAGKLSNASGLPSWLTFNKDSITFDGTTPDTKYPFTLELVLDAYDEWRHCIGNQTFNFTVAKHELSSVVPVLPALKVVPGSHFEFDLKEIVAPYIRLDGKQLAQLDAQKLKFDLVTAPSGLHLQNCSIGGIGPSSPSQVIIGISSPEFTYASQHSLDISLPISIDTSGSYFTTPQIPSISVPLGKPFSFPFVPYLSNLTSWGKDVKLEASYQPENSSSWLTFSTSPPAIHGDVPSHGGATHVNVTLKAMNPNSNAVSTTSLHVSFVASPSAHPGAAASPGPQTNVKRVKMAVGLTLGIVGGFILLCCLMAIIRRSVGEQAQEGKILPGSRSKLKEYVIDHLQDGPYGGLEKEREHKPANDKQLLPAAYVSDLDTDPEFTSGKRPEAAQTSPPRPPETKKSPTMLKRDFFKPASHHPSRGNVLGFPAAFRKVSPSSIKSAIQDKFSSLKRQRPTLPLISRPLPFTLKRVPPQRAPSNPNTRRSLSSRSNDSHNHAQPGSSQSGAQWDSQLALHNALDSDRSFEGVVSLPSRGHTNNEEGIVGMNSHVFIKKERFSLEFPGIANTVSHSNLPYERSSPRGFSRSVSDYERTDGMELRPDISEEAVVSRAISVKVDRNSGPTARRYSSAAAAFEDTKRNTPTSSDQLLVSHLFGYSTGELTFSTSAPSITRPGPAVVKTKTHLRETPAPENGVRKVSNKVDVQSRVNAGPSDLARSSQALLYGEDSWTKY